MSIGYFARFCPQGRIFPKIFQYLSANKEELWKITSCGEIDKIGKLIEALLQKAGILRRSGAGEAVCETARTELAEALDLDIDTLLAREDFIGVLTREYGFSDENLEKFAELLFDFAAASPDRDATVRLACGITAIYRYLDEKRAPVSLNRYYILKELENMTAR